MEAHIFTQKRSASERVAQNLGAPNGKADTSSARHQMASVATLAGTVAPAWQKAEFPKIGTRIFRDLRGVEDFGARQFCQNTYGPLSPEVS